MSRVARAVALTALTLCCASATVGCGVIDRPVSGTRVAQDVYVPLSENAFAMAVVDSSTRFDTYRAEMTSDDMSMDIRIRFEDDGEFSFRSTVDEAGDVVTMLGLDGEVYVRDKGQRTFFQFPDELAAQMLADIEMGQPLTMARDFASGMESLEYGGAFNVDYGKAHQYDVTMSDEFLAEQLRIEPEQVPNVVYRMWLDDTHLLHRITTWVETYRVDFRISEWGEPVEVEAPPKHLVKPLPMPTDAT
ncbi:hypothetical protein HNR19_000745 [Nocardioides thalensis]|uniref:LppX_LprAFG lipoprotein n=1 Tax=Nocardioides thalensis TaxID=1914755 RepID=A0A853BYW4_9ACTN|nr:hypothetical protein [Nocardioides thalensis]NYJ00047.1 hypothetical protein [Nocardioides thalensis]